ncbi:hypothetical protein M8494_18460 [Serratia ureilytica]
MLHMKFIGSGATATQPQLAIAEFIRGGHHSCSTCGACAPATSRTAIVADRPYPETPRPAPARAGARRLYAVDRTGRGVRDTLRLNCHLEQQACRSPSAASFRRRQTPQPPAHQSARRSDGGDRTGGKRVGATIQCTDAERRCNLRRTEANTSATRRRRCPMPCG